MHVHETHFLGGMCPCSRLAAWTRAFAARGFGALVVVVLILCGKFARGIVYFDDPFVCACENRTRQ